MKMTSTYALARAAAVLAIALPGAVCATEDAGLGGPSSVKGQIEGDQEAREATPAGPPRRPTFRERLARDYGLAVGGDYQALYQHATESPGRDDASSGVLRFYGHWTPGGQDASSAGSLVFKAEHRHRLAAIAPQALAPAAGVSGLTAVPFSNAGALLTNLYWSQPIDDKRFSFLAGVVDVTDYLDVFGLMNPWTDFNNYAFTTNPTIPAPDPGLGAAAGWMFTPNYYVVGGIADANGHPHQPEKFFDSFFGKAEYFRHLELGWIGSRDSRFEDNAHVTLWQQDAREDRGIGKGKGVALSLSRALERWLPFVRAGWSDGGGAPFERMASAGVGYQVGSGDYAGVGASWGRVPAAADGTRGRDQGTFEAYYRWQVLKGLQVVPGVQYVHKPAYNLAADDLWILSLRMRATF